MKTGRTKKASEKNSPCVRYTKDIFVYKDRSVRDSDGKFLGQYVGRELDNFIPEFNERMFCPPCSDGNGFHVVYIFVKKDDKYYEVNWLGEFKEITFLQLSLWRIERKSHHSSLIKWTQKNFGFPLPLLKLLVGLHQHGCKMEDLVDSTSEE